ncbi:MAG TPA: bifunctional phosphopantothenoylcysteine decarboxylase/phosphopantothenate--cysteine ligase CoaBC, partial [Gaiellaceae bacterium]|nr:bifunctional phosphopantothenoylcysteine decarboxylase/phosphopantothenate--cysteine ligase CoaBC [Gaiellaceae bacterium]
IAAYKACEVCRLLVRRGHEVVPLLTPGAEQFVGAQTFRALARRPPGDDVFLHLTRADLLLVAPCTANTLAKLAYGLADNVLTEAALAHRGPMLVAPAMNPRMWSHAATRANAETLRARGVVLVGPDEGETAEGELGVGRMAEPEDIVDAAEALLAGTGPLAGKRVLVSAGGTREPIDSVRFVGNRSSGRMGVALAAEARRRGARVTLLGANLTIAAPEGVELVETPTAADLAHAAAEHGPGADVVIMAAAVADYRPAETIAAKRPKDRAAWTVELEPTVDVLAALGTGRRPGQVLVGFAADHGETGLERARQKRTNKQADLFVFNDVGREDIGFDSPDNAVTLVGVNGERELPKAPKSEIAAAILDEVERLLG